MSIEKLLSGYPLSKEEAKNLMRSLTDASLSSAQVAAILTAYKLRSVTASEILGFREVLIDLAEKPDVATDDLLDVCGTGGDGKNTFNISTITALVLASLGKKVAKHGNYSFSSVCGSSNVLEQLGLKFTNNSALLKQSLEEANICFLHAPLFHPALKNVGPVRKELGFRTIFNILGPLVNPLQPKYQLAGVSTLDLQLLYKSILQETGSHYAIAYSYDGYDEISLTGRFRVFSSVGDFEFLPEELNLQKLNPEALSGGTSIKDAVEIFSSIIAGKGTEAQNQVIAINAAFALKVLEPEKEIIECFHQAIEVLKTTQVKETLDKVVKIYA